MRLATFKTTLLFLVLIYHQSFGPDREILATCPLKSLPLLIILFLIRQEKFVVPKAPMTPLLRYGTRYGGFQVLYQYGGGRERGEG